MGFIMQGFTVRIIFKWDYRNSIKVADLNDDADSGLKDFVLST